MLEIKNEKKIAKPPILGMKPVCEFLPPVSAKYFFLIAFFIIIGNDKYVDKKLIKKINFIFLF